MVTPEFLDKRAGITSVVTMLPNAVGLAVKDLSNGTIHHCGLSMLEHCDTTILCQEEMVWILRYRLCIL